MDSETLECLETQIGKLEQRIEKSMSEKFSHLEKLMTQTAGTNDKDHERMARQIGELYEENKRDRETADHKAERIVEELDSKIDRNGQRISILEQRQSADEGGAKAKEMSQGKMITIILGGLGLLLGMFELIPLFIK